jgi:hypothetical protein
LSGWLVGVISAAHYTTRQRTTTAGLQRMV